MTSTVDVAAAVILREDGRFLLGQRAEGTVYAGYWEFPGGKVESGESPRDALQRELEEELGIEVVTAHPWLCREFVYPHAHVRLHFFRVSAWRGELRDHIHAALAWQDAHDATVSPMLPANAPVLRALALPDWYAITHAGDFGVERQLARLEEALAGGLRLFQVREPGLPPETLRMFGRQAVALARHHGARVLINGDAALATELRADGVHFKAAQLRQLARRPDLPLVAASCHDAGELAKAAALELDFVVLGPVRPTATHPQQPGLGWQAFAALAQEYPLPIYALGGLGPQDLPQAWSAGAHGIAAIRAAWGD